MRGKSTAFSTSTKSFLTFASLNGVPILEGKTRLCCFQLFPSFSASASTRCFCSRSTFSDVSPRRMVRIRKCVLGEPVNEPSPGNRDPFGHRISMRRISEGKTGYLVLFWDGFTRILSRKSSCCLMTPIKPPAHLRIDFMKV